MNETIEKIPCTVCAQHTLKTIINFGHQPPANRFITHEMREKEQEMHALGLGFCQCCKTIQLKNRMPLQAMKPRHSWLVYNEPEGHLDAVAAQLRSLPGIDPSSRMLGVTYKDQSTLDRLTNLGITTGKCFSNDEFNIYRIPCLANEMIEKQEKVDLLLARHVAEHAENATNLILLLKKLLSPNGYLILELPDSEKIFKAGNHAFVWEEHISYFTEPSLAAIADKVGAKLVWSARYSYDSEDSLIAILQWQNAHEFPKVVSHCQLEVDLLVQQFAADFAAAKLEWRKNLQNYRDQGQQVAVFGAGHLAVKWINFLGLSDLLDCVIDDHPHKAGMYMPGSKLPILPSSALYKRNIKVCISTLSPESEQKVKSKHSKYFEEGGIFIPAFKAMSQI